MTIGEKIKKARQEKNITQKELAEQIGCAEITIRQYESNKREPKLEIIKKIATVLNITVLELLPDLSLVSDLSNETIHAQKLLLEKIHTLDISSSKKNELLDNAHREITKQTEIKNMTNILLSGDEKSFNLLSAFSKSAEISINNSALSAFIVNS